MRKRAHPSPVAALALLGCMLCAESSLAGQTGGRDDWSTRPWVGDLTFFGANALTSAVSAGILQSLRGGSFNDGFTRGVLGGAIHYGGRRLSARPFDGAGILGRQIAAVGGSIIHNAADARPTLDRLMFPLGPLHLHVRLDQGISVRPKLNLGTTLVAAAAASDGKLDWDPGASLSAGAFVFRSPNRTIASHGEEPVGGMMLQGNIFISDVGRGEHDRHIFAHERVHVLQEDWHFQAWGDPAEEWVLGRIPGGATIHRFIDVDFLATGVTSGLVGLFDIPYDHRLYELEAEFLADR